MRVIMSCWSTDDNSGCAAVILLAIGLVLGFAILGCIAELTSDIVGADFNTVLAWEMGLAGTVAFVWLVLRNPLLRFSLMVTGTAIGMMVLLLALNGGDEEILNAGWAKPLVTAVSVGMGALYLFWEVKQHPLD